MNCRRWRRSGLPIFATTQALDNTGESAGGRFLVRRSGGLQSPVLATSNTRHPMDSSATKRSRQARANDTATVAVQLRLPMPTSPPASQSFMRCRTYGMPHPISVDPLHSHIPPLDRHTQSQALLQPAARSTQYGSGLGKPTAPAVACMQTWPVWQICVPQAHSATGEGPSSGATASSTAASTAVPVASEKPPTTEGPSGIPTSLLLLLPPPQPARRSESARSTKTRAI